MEVENKGAELKGPKGTDFLKMLTFLVLIVYYSMYGHIADMANAVAEGVKDGGGNAFVKRVKEWLP